MVGVCAAEAAFLALLDTPPPLADFADSRCPFDGVTGREVSGVDVGVTSAEVGGLFRCCRSESRPGMGGDGSSGFSVGSDVEVESLWII